MKTYHLICKLSLVIWGISWPEFIGSRVKNAVESEFDNEFNYFAPIPMVIVLLFYALSPGNIPNYL